MKPKKIPIRTCIVTNISKPKKELVRIVANKEGLVFIDLNGKQNGRGAYLTKSKEVFLKAKQNKVLDRKLKTKVPLEIYDELLNLL